MQYQRLFFEKVFFPYCKANNITEIIHLGDLFDNRRHITIRTLNFVRTVFLEPLAEMGMHMRIVPGNHDTAYKNTNDLCSLHEVLQHYPVTVDLHMLPEVVSYGNTQVGLVPWINETNHVDAMNFIATAPCSVLAGHFEVAGFKYIANSGMKSVGESLSLFSKYDLVFSGHYHTRGVKKNVNYLGSQYQFNWSDVDDKKYFHVFDSETLEVKAVANRHKLYYRFYYDDTGAEKLDNILTSAHARSHVEGKYVRIVVTKKNDFYLFDQFVTHIKMLDPFDLSIIENFEVKDEDGKSIDIKAIDDTSSLIDDYVDNVLVTHLDKNKIKRLMQQLHEEANLLDTVN